MERTRTLQKNAVNLLFTSAGRRVELLTAFKRAYQSLDLAGHIIALDIDPLAPALQVADKAYIVPRLDKPEYISEITAICQHEQVDQIFPLIDPDIPLLARHRATIEATGARLAVISENAAEITHDKWLTYQFFNKIGVPTPASWLPATLGASATLPYPLFIKPRHGSASAHTFRVNNPREMDFFVDYVPNPIIQAYLPGAEITNDVICDIDGELLAVVCRQRLQVRSGEVSKGVTIHNEEIMQWCQRIAAALPALGPITVQCIMQDNRPYFTEINARLGGGVTLSVAANVDFPKWLLARASGIPMPIPPLGTYHAPLYLARFDHEYYLTEDEREQFTSYHI